MFWLFNTSKDEWENIDAWCWAMAQADYSRNANCRYCYDKGYHCFHRASTITSGTDPADIDLRRIRQEQYWAYLELHCSHWGTLHMENIHAAFDIMQTLQKKMRGMGPI